MASTADNSDRMQTQSQPAQRQDLSPLSGIGWVSILLTAVVIGSLLYLFLSTLITFGALLRFPFDYDQGEGFELWNAVLLTRGRSFYTDNSVYPFYSSLYGPAWPVLLAPFVAVFGPHIWIGRAWSFLATLVIAFCIGYVVYREGRQLPVTALAALSFLASNFVHQVGPLSRQHMTMVMFSVLGLVLLSRYLDQPAGKAKHLLWAALVCLLMAGYTKQLAINAVASAFLFYLLRRPKEAIAHGAYFGLATGATFLIVHLLSGGHFYENIITANQNPFISGQAEAFYAAWWGLHWALIVPGALYVVYAVYADRITIWNVFWIASVALGALSGKWGAGISYFIDAVVASCIGTGLLFGKLHHLLHDPVRVGNARWHRFALAVYSVALPLVYAQQAWLNLRIHLDHPLTAWAGDLLAIPETSEHRFRQEYFDSAGYTQIGHAPTEADIAAGWRIVEWARSTDKPVWSEEAMFSIHANKEVVTDPAVILNLYQSGHLDISEMISLIESQAFGVVIFRARFYPAPILDAIGQHYQVAEQIEMNGFTYDILVPRGHTAESRSDSPAGP